MILLYDGSFEGFLTVIFECYAQKITPDNICTKDQFQNVLFAQKEFIPTITECADRVWRTWQKKLSNQLNQLPFQAFLSQEPGIEMKLLHFAQVAFSSKIQTEGNYSDPKILDIRKAARRVNQEAMHMLQFIRFQLTKDKIYFAATRPRYNVLPMTLKHFKNRFTDQQWLLYDLKRDYGFFYNLQTIEAITLGEKNFNIQDGTIYASALQESEANYQQLWKNYCQSTTIKERLNPKLQKQFMPKRYWKFLPEKK